MHSSVRSNRPAIVPRHPRTWLMVHLPSILFPGKTMKPPMLYASASTRRALPRRGERQGASSCSRRRSRRWRARTHQVSNGDAVTRLAWRPPGRSAPPKKGFAQQEFVVLPEPRAVCARVLEPSVLPARSVSPEVERGVEHYGEVAILAKLIARRNSERDFALANSAEERLEPGSRVASWPIRRAAESHPCPCRHPSGRESVCESGRVPRARTARRSRRCGWESAESKYKPQWLRTRARWPLRI